MLNPVSYVRYPRSFPSFLTAGRFRHFLIDAELVSLLFDVTQADS
jgi:hypothetical protein